MNQGVPSRITAACAGLAAFAIAIICGLSVDNPAHVILTRAVVSMFVCYPVGLVIGAVAERAVEEAIRAHAAAANADSARSTSGASGAKTI